MNNMEKEVKEIYNNMGEKYLEREKENWRDKKYVDLFLSYIQGNNILDIGCGTGELLEYYINKNYYVSGIDLSDELLSIAQKRVPEAKLYNMSVLDINTLKEKYDAISATYLLVHIPKDKIKQLLLSIKERLNNHGILFLVFTNNNPATLKSNNVIDYSLDEIKNQLLKEGFIILFTEIIDVIPTIQIIIAQKD